MDCRMSGGTATTESSPDGQTPDQILADPKAALWSRGNWVVVTCKLRSETRY